MKYCGSTFPGKKLLLCVEKFWVVGHFCTSEGRIADESRIAPIRDWTVCANKSDVRSFLGTVGVLRIFIRNFVHRAHHLVKLTRKDIPWEWSEEQIRAMGDLRDAVINSPALKPLDYESDSPVILAVDTSYIAVGYFLCHCSPEDVKRRNYSRFGSITLNEREARFSQAKLEIYGLFRALRATRLWIIGVRKLVVETDARYIKGMLANPDIQPSASINRWILSILTFHFELVHVKGTFHGPDGLSRHPRQPDDPIMDNDDFDFNDWIDNLHGFIHIIQPLPIRQCMTINGVQILSVEEDRENQLDGELSYDNVPRNERDEKEELRIEMVKEWHKTLGRPAGLTDAKYMAFIKFAMGFIVDKERLWQKHSQGFHQLVLPKEQ